jgi:16S rRNA (cytosine1402-N4)-methyltransferase
LDAWTVVNTYSEEELVRIFYAYGEESNARRIARQIVKVRAESPINTTLELAETVKAALPAKVKNKKGHPAKKVFQAIRIEVNKEMQELEDGLAAGLDMLAPGGRMAVITFHSLEDRMVKEAFKKAALPPKTDRRLPAVEEKRPYTLLTRKPIVPGNEELEDNPRAHSAKLRGIEKDGKEEDSEE